MPRIQRYSIIFIFAVVASALLPAMSFAGTVHGTVKNGTTNKPAAGIQVILIQLQGGMQPVANTQSDAQGQFTFDNPSLGAQPMLVRAVYHGVNFHQPVPPGKSDVEVSVYDLTKDAKAISVTTRVVFFQPNGANLIVGEEYSLQNDAQPPQAFFRPDGNFEFSLPEKAQLQQIAAAGPAGMPVVQAPIDKSNGHFAIAYAFRPGENTVRYSYELPYPNNTALIKIPPSAYLAKRLLVVAPPTVLVSGDGLQSGGQEQGMSIYGRENVAANSTVAVTLSGTAPPPSDVSNSSQGQGQGGGGEGGSSNSPIQQVPGRLDVLKWPLVGGFIVVFALGAILLARKPVAITVSSDVPDDDTDDAAVQSPRKRKSKSEAPPTKISAPAPAPMSLPAAKVSESAPLLEQPAPTLRSVDAAVATSLDALKEQLFRLELRHQAGTISDAEYNSERSRTEKILRDLVRG